jgi:LysM repeat protein
VEAVCPLLALGGDGRSVVEGVDDTHRCHAEQPPLPLDRHFQARTCLTDAHVRCERYLAFVARNGPPERSRAAFGQGLVSTRMTLAPEPAWRGLAGRAVGSRQRGLLAVTGLVMAVILGGGVTVAWVLGALPLAGLAASPTPEVAPETSSPSATTVVTPPPSPSPTATPRPTATPTTTPVPTPAPSPTPAPTATPARTYTVQRGDTLAEIANRFGSTVEAIQAANGIEDPDEILIGQVLVIP